MVEKNKAEEIATERVCHLLMSDYAVKVSDAGNNWLVRYTPIAKVRGGGFEVVVAKESGTIVEAVSLQ